MLGRLSLNPAVHIDPIGTIVFPLVAMATNLPLIGWAKPVPVNPAELRPNWRQKFMLVAAAGPASNLVLAAAAALVLRGLAPVEASGDAIAMSLANRLEYLLETMVFVNVLLAVFNLVPIPPLDGGNLLAGLLPQGLARLVDAVRPYGFLLIYALMFTGTLSRLISSPYFFLLSWLR